MPDFIQRFILLCCFISSSQVFAQSTVQLISTDKSSRLAVQLQVYYEPEVQLSVQEVSKNIDKFAWHSGDNPNYGFSNKGLWLYTTISNVTDVEKWVVDVAFSQLDKVDIYLLLDGEILAQVKQGKERFNQHYRLPTIKAALPYAQTIDLFVRIESRHSSLIAPVDIQTHDRHERTNFYDTLIWGLFYGALLILAIYNLIIYFGIREKSLLAYVAYIASAILWQFVWSGHSHLIMPEGFSRWENQHTDLIFVIIAITSGIFSWVFLDISKNAPKSMHVVRACIVILLILGLCSVVNLFPPFWQATLVYIVCLVAISSYTCAGFEAYNNHFNAARYYIFAWSIVTTTALIGMLSLSGVFPSNFFTTYCFQFGVFIEAGLFSLALMDKNRHQLEQEIDQATDDLRNNIVLVEEQNVRLDIARKEAINASNVKSQFLANMSHEIRTPLNAILGFSKELHSAELSAEKQEQVSIINAAADNLLSIVNDVLDFSKIEAGKLRINNHPFSPTQIIEDLISVMAKSAHLKNLEFIYDLSPLPEKLIGDSFRIKQILNNLLGNALKFTDHGHIGLSVKGTFLEHGMYELTLKIEDTGIGISREDRRKLFAAFSQVDDALSRSYQGTGLGLVICQELVKLMRGDLSLHSTVGQGSTFTVTLRTNLLNAKLALRPDSEWRNKKVVFYDPIPHSRFCGVKLLKNLGAVVTGVESLAFLRQLNDKYDMVFICVPGNKENDLPNVLEATRQMSCQQAIILYSGINSLSNRSDLSQYFDHKLRLPLTMSRLTNLLHLPQTSPIDAIQLQLANLPKARVLAVDDMEMNLRLLTTWFKNTKLQLTLAYSGKDAVLQCYENEFDLILMDVQMPHMDGIETTKRIRQTELNLGTPIIAVTAHAFKEEQDKLLASGMDDYLPKPLNLSDLIDLIIRWCQQIEETPQELAHFDWSLAMTRANQNEAAAIDILEQFVKQLPGLASNIEQCFQALDYTGVARLHKLCDAIESALKRQQYELVGKKMQSFNTAIQGVLFSVRQGQYIS
ncbi:hybrid sensor histidine kinase/response regulator [Paraglaciecola hydrolytica]|uniref:histidine kinase n=1 Tax=Paraglaciecola hydrolytica TaxID=1799789 RepID=A0A136A3B0_9ALTE|nr:hybrid sensor histidine kinase/response regulator [Paraglaciecola hydrolytica]KXI29721.1 two-component system sensor histidine kinase/response regulator [Paraglaciecola hydrolytica]